jgi:hypothetical protein
VHLSLPAPRAISRFKKLWAATATGLLAGCASPALRPTTSSSATDAGSVVVGVCVDAAGHILGNPWIVDSSGQARLDNGALNLVRSGDGRFVPATTNGIATVGCRHLRIQFSGQSQPTLSGQDPQP